jgi:hypothetical protein
VLILHLAIAHSQIRGVKPYQIAQAILLAKEGVLSAQHLEMLLKYIPTPAEVSKKKKKKKNCC